MIKYKQGDLLDVTEGVILHGCNAQGVMGSGVALSIKHKYPTAFELYKTFERLQGLKTGMIIPVKVSSTLHVVSLITQTYYGRDPTIRYVSYTAIRVCFEKLHKLFLTEIPFHFPKIGAGLANGDWQVIQEIITETCPKRDLVCWII